MSQSTTSVSTPYMSHLGPVNPPATFADGSSLSIGSLNAYDADTSVGSGSATFDIPSTWTSSPAWP